MDVFSSLAIGFGVALQPINLAYCFMGVFIGTLIGVLPGIGPVAAMSLLMPLTFRLTPEASIIMMAGIYYGAMYGGSTTAILVNIPGEAASIVTTIDGYQMAKQGRAGPALGISAFGSFIAGTFAVLALTVAAPPLASIAVKFGPAEYFSLMALGLTILAYLTVGSILKSLAMACIGLTLGLVGIDQMTALPRMTYGRLELLDGVGIIPIAMGLFGIGEILFNIEKRQERSLLGARIESLLPTRDDWKQSAGPIARGSLLGFVLGILPGGGAVIASFASYAMEKRVSKHPERFGKGAIEGVAGPEAANNAAAGGAFIPLLTLGIPPNVVMALLLGAFIINNVEPGPLMMQKHPQLFWGIVCSMYVGNVMLLVLNLPLIGMWVRLLTVPYKVLFPLILLFCVIGGYSVSNSIFDLYLMMLFSVIGYFMKKFGYEPAPMVLAFVLGPMLELNLRKALILSHGELSTFVTRPISLGCLLIAAALLTSALLPMLRKKRAVIALDAT
jgi:putative tricarboxylic transport membrane protein